MSERLTSAENAYFDGRIDGAEGEPYAPNDYPEGEDREAYERGYAEGVAER